MSRRIGPGVVPVRTAAKMLRVSRQRVYELIALGAIAAQKVDGTWLVFVESVRERSARKEVAGAS